MAEADCLTTSHHCAAAWMSIHLLCALLLHPDFSLFKWEMQSDSYHLLLFTLTRRKPYSRSCKLIILKLPCLAQNFFAIIHLLFFLWWNHLLLMVTWNLILFGHELVKYLEFGGEWFCTHKLFTFKMFTLVQFRGNCIHIFKWGSRGWVIYLTICELWLMQYACLTFKNYSAVERFFFYLKFEK